MRANSRTSVADLCSQFGIWTPTDSSAFTLPLEVAAVQQMAICGTHVPVERRILRLQTREAHWSLVQEQLQPRASLAVVQDEEQVGSVGDDAAGPKNSSCDRKGLEKKLYSNAVTAGAGEAVTWLVKELLICSRVITAR